MVLKRCVYGVDKNPMAVELAKVALWLHTFTVGAPLSFVDHHLRRGDSLFGAWVSDTMAAVKKRGGSPLLLHDSISTAMGSAFSMREIEALTDAEIAEARNSAGMFVGVRNMTAPLDRFMATLHALDWLNPKDKADVLAVRAWLDGVFGDAVLVALGKVAVPTEREDGARFAVILAAARSLAEEQGFLNWQVAFPGVWEDWEGPERKGGFDVVIGNPPWDRIKLQQVEWFAARRPEIAKATRASDRAKMIKALEEADDPLWDDFAIADRRAADAARVARQSGDYPLLSGGDTNLNSLFVERAHALVKPNGLVGFIVPSGLASDQSSSAFFRKITEENRLHCFIDFFNRRYNGSLYFSDVYYRFKFCVYIASGMQKQFDSARYGFFIRSLDEVTDPDRVFPISRFEINLVNPNSGTAPIFRSRRDKDITFGIYERNSVLNNKRLRPEKITWLIQYTTLFHMANDSSCFRKVNELEEKEGAWRVSGYKYQSPKGDWVPLYEGKMVQAFDHRASNIVMAAANVFRPGQGEHISSDEHADPDMWAMPRYWVQKNLIDIDSRLEWFISIKDVTSATNARTIISAIIPRVGQAIPFPL